MKFFLFLFLIFSGAAYADWTKTGFSDESTMFINTQTIKKNGDLVRVTYLLNFPLGTKSPDDKIPYKSGTTVEEFDCINNSSRTISFDWYSDTMGSGKKVYEDKHSYPFKKITHGSLVEGVKEKVCK